MSSSCFSSAFARITFLAAAFTAVSVLAASSLEDGGDAEPDNDGELDGPPVLSFASAHGAPAKQGERGMGGRIDSRTARVIGRRLSGRQILLTVACYAEAGREGELKSCPCTSPKRSSPSAGGGRWRQWRRAGWMRS